MCEMGDCSKQKQNKQTDKKEKKPQINHALTGPQWWTTGRGGCRLMEDGPAQVRWAGNSGGVCESEVMWLMEWRMVLQTSPRQRRTFLVLISFSLLQEARVQVFRQDPKYIYILKFILIPH